jgi:phytoene desaturase
MGKAIVIGAGIAGIAVSIRLALKGWNVTVLESNTYPGGKLSQFVIGDFRFDAGPSLFTLPELVDELFALAGRKPEYYFRHVPLEMGCKYFYEDGTVLNAWADPQRFAKEVEEKLGIPANRLIAHLNDAARKYSLTKGIFLERSLHKLRSYFQKDVFKAILNIRSLDLGKTMHEANEEALSEPKLVQLFDRFATYNGSNPYRAPGVLNLIPHLEHGIGASFPMGGMIEITNSLVRLADELGVQFEYGKAVQRIIVENGRAKGVEVAGNLRVADLIVSNMDIVPTYRKLLFDQKAPEKVLHHERSSSALIFYWGIDRVFDELELHNIFFSQDYESEFQGIFEEGELAADPSVYVHISSKMEVNDAPEGKENWFVMVNVPGNKGQDWDAIIPRIRAAVVAKLTRILGKDISDCIQCESVLDPRLIESKTSSYQGSLYGASSNSRMSAFFRHANFSRDIKGLYFCGGSVHPGGGIPLCLLSAKIVASLVDAA